MGKRGPAPLPIPLKILRGTSPGRDSGGRPIRQTPAFEKAPPEPSPWLTGPARQLWDRLVPDLSVLDLLKPGDGPALEALCSAYGDVVEATEILEREGLVATNPQSGHVAAHPMVT
jgi:phage terminase small subunit